MAENQDVEQKVLEYLQKAGQVKARAVAKSLNMDKEIVSKAIANLAKNDKIEYIYLDTTYLKVKGK